MEWRRSLRPLTTVLIQQLGLPLAEKGPQPPASKSQSMTWDLATIRLFIPAI
ncbi:Hypothetical predicted protein [Pelobates cultripes]|uniref:Uncharacterized protein n=1 Tax=Pelobates cultripes TaxID=61616 RepID=A0AAD1REN6_PELCU|nr:Hypothetical predicted protein [Pelobates cultripes]